MTSPESKEALSLAILCFPSPGGSGVVASELASGLAERGHRVHLFASARPPRLTDGRVQFHRFETPGYPVLDHAPYTLSAASAMLDAMRRERFDLIQVHYAIPHAASAHLARLAFGADAPLQVTSLHGSDVTHLGGHPAYRAIVSAEIAASDGVTTPSVFLKREALRCLDLPPSMPIEVIPNFVDSDRFTPSATATRDESIVTFVHVSNLRPVKRVGLLIELFARIRRARAARLLIVGDGPDRTLAEKRARELGIAESVLFLGVRPDVAAVYQTADAFLMTSESESFGLAALEAMSAGLPVFAFRVGGLPEVVPPECGALADTLESLALRVLDAMAIPGRLTAMGRAARAHAVAHFGRAAALDRTEAYFRRLLERREERSR